MPTEPQEGYTEYKPLMRLDFEKLSRRCQVLELQRTGILVDNGDDAVKFYYQQLSYSSINISRKTRYDGFIKNYGN